MVGISGLGAGFDVAGVVAQLMAAERAPLARYNTFRLAALAQQSAYSDLTSRFSALRLSADGLDTAAKFATSSATSSDPTVFSASATSAAAPGSVAFRVTRLAVGEQRTSAALSSGSTLVGASRFAVSSGLGPLGTGFTSLTADAGVTTGPHTVTVSRVPAPARALGTDPLGATLTIGAGADQLVVGHADGSSTTVTLPVGEQTSSAVVAALNEQLGGRATASTVDGRLQLTSRDLGPTASLSLSGSALGALHLGAGTSTGADAEVSVDGGVTQAVRLTGAPGETVVLHGKTASTPGFTLTVGDGLRRGTVTTQVVETGADTTVTELVGRLGGSGSPTGAALIDLGGAGPDQLRLVLSAAASGSAGGLSLSGDVPAVLSGATVSTAAQDAQILIAGQTVSRSSNTVTDLLPGVTLRLLKASPDTDVTVSTAPDSASFTSKAKAFVDALNAALSSVATQTASSAEKRGPLAGNSTVRGMSAALFSAASSTAGSALTPSLSAAGLRTSREGRFTLDETALAAAYDRDPSGVATMLASFAASVGAQAKRVSSFDGTLKTAQASAGAEAGRRQQQMDAMEERLSRVETRLSAQYAKLDAAMGTLAAQRSRLGAQLSGLFS